MRTIKNLTSNHERVWFYLKDKETEDLFVRDLNEMGATYLNGKKISPSNCSPIMAVHADGKVAHLMIMIWNASFSPTFKEHCSKSLANAIKVDYAKYIGGDSDYICHTSEFVPI